MRCEVEKSKRFAIRRHPVTRTRTPAGGRTPARYRSNPTASSLTSPIAHSTPSSKPLTQNLPVSATSLFPKPTAYLPTKKAAYLSTSRSEASVWKNPLKKCKPTKQTRHCKAKNLCTHYPAQYSLRSPRPACACCAVCVLLPYTCPDHTP